MRKYLSIPGSNYLSSFVFFALFLLAVPSTLSGIELAPAGKDGSEPNIKIPGKVGQDPVFQSDEEKQAALPGPNPVHGEKIKTPKDMVLIPAGDFMAGMDPRIGYQECLKYAKSCETEWYEHEAPMRDIWIDAFYMDKYEVTQKEFETVMGKNPSKYKGGDLPVERALWKEANKYCEKLGKRLPTEAEWEKAARGKADTLYPWGNEVEADKANFCDVNCKAYFKAHQFDDGYKATAPVGSYPPNGYGLYDMAGNVWEWVSDWYGASYYKERPRRNPQGPFSGQDLFHVHGMKKVLRGGSWGNNASAMRTATRSWAHHSRVSRRGFRCALDASIQP